MGDWSGRRAYVVGGSMGIGLAAARALAARGADCVLFARRPGPLDDARREVRAAHPNGGKGCDCRVLDAADESAVRAVMDEALRELGPPDLLLNCAGRARPEYFERIPVAQLEESLRLNVVTAWNTVQALLPALEERRGTIVNTASVAGLIGVFGYADYCAAKFAVVGLSEALRQELAPRGVTVQVLCPPDTDTPGFAEENETKPAETKALSASGGILSAEAVAEALIAGIAGGRFLIVPGRDARLSVLAKRLVPGIVERVMARTVEKARRG